MGIILEVINNARKVLDDLIDDFQVEKFTLFFRVIRGQTPKLTFHERIKKFRQAYYPKRQLAGDCDCGGEEINRKIRQVKR